MKIRLIIILCLIGLLGGCQTPLPEINYRGVLSSEIDDAVSAADKFLAAFTKESGFAIESRVFRHTASKDEITVDYILRSSATKKVWIYVTAYSSNRLIGVTIAGEFSSKVAVKAAHASERVFTRLFPKANYIQFRRVQGLLGP